MITTSDKILDSKMGKNNCRSLRQQKVYQTATDYIKTLKMGKKDRKKRRLSPNQEQRMSDEPSLCLYLSFYMYLSLYLPLSFYLRLTLTLTLYLYLYLPLLLPPPPPPIPPLLPAAMLILEGKKKLTLA